jgi:hypothetical protein
VLIFLSVLLLFRGEFQTYVGETLAAVKAHSLESAVTQHLHDLGILLAILLEGQLSALVIVLLGSSSAVLAALLCAKKKKLLAVGSKSSGRIWRIFFFSDRRVRGKKPHKNLAGEGLFWN